MSAKRVIVCVVGSYEKRYELPSFPRWFPIAERNRPSPSTRPWPHCDHGLPSPLGPRVAHQLDAWLPVRRLLRDHGLRRRAARRRRTPATIRAVRGAPGDGRRGGRALLRLPRLRLRGERGGRDGDHHDGQRPTRPRCGATARGSSLRSGSSPRCTRQPPASDARPRHVRHVEGHAPGNWLTERLRGSTATPNTKKITAAPIRTARSGSRAPSCWPSSTASASAATMPSVEPIQVPTRP